MKEHREFLKWLESEPYYKAKAYADDDYAAAMWKAWQGRGRV